MSSAALLCPTPRPHQHSLSMRPPTLPPPLEEDLYEGGVFAIARVNGAIRLVQVSSATPASALTTVDVKIFRHEFIHIFRFLEYRTLHPSDVHIIETIPSRAVALDDNDGAYLAKDVLAKISRLSAPKAPATGRMGMGHARYPSVGGHGQTRRVAYANPRPRPSGV